MRLTTLGDVIDGLGKRRERHAIVAFQRDGNLTIDRGELADRIDLVASGLVGLGIVKGQRVAVLAPNRPNWIVAALASIRAGAVVVPIDAQVPDRALKHILRDAEPQVLFTVKAQEERVRKSHAAPRTVILLDEDDRAKSTYRKPEAPGERANGFPNLDADDPAVHFYTSGTTGLPKGVPLTHRNLVHQLNVMAEIELLRSKDRVLLPLPFHHVYPFVMGILAPLALSVPIVLPQALTGPQLVRAASAGKVTVIVGVPRLYRALLDGVRREARTGGRLKGVALWAALGLSTLVRRWLGLRIGRYLLAPVRKRIGPHIRVVASGGAALPPEVAYQLEALGWRVASGYGLTETSPLLTINRPGASRLRSAGKPIPGVELRIDPTSPTAQPESAPEGAPRSTVPPRAPIHHIGHVEGEVLARGPNIFSGYHNLPEKTQEALTDDGWFRTGDLGWIDRAGFLHLTGRVSTMIVTEGGKHVQPDDVEEAYEKHPAIREIGVLQKENPSQLVAVVVPQRKHGNGGDADAAVRQALEEQGRRLRPYERIAEYAITNESLPRTQLGKVQHHLLEEVYERAKVGKSKERQTGRVAVEAMSGEDQELLRDPAALAVWEWLAERSTDVRLTPDSNLRTELQIDSMEWLNLTLEIGERAGVEIEDEAIGRIETVRDLLQEVSTASSGGEAEATRLEEVLTDPKQFLDDEQRRWLKRLSPGQAALARALTSVVRAVMRLTFRVEAVGVEHLPAKGNFVIAANHVSYLDPFAIAAVLGNVHLKRTYWAGWTGVAFRGPLTRWFSRLAKAVPVDPERAVLSSLALAAAVLDRGENLVWFPEGERSPDGRLKPLRPGLGIVLQHQPTVVIPTFIDGAHQAMPPGRYLPRPHRIRVIFGEGVESDVLEREDEGDEAHERITAALQKRLKALARKAHR